MGLKGFDISFTEVKMKINESKMTGKEHSFMSLCFENKNIGSKDKDIE